MGAVGRQPPPVNPFSKPLNQGHPRLPSHPEICCGIWCLASLWIFTCYLPKQSKPRSGPFASPFTKTGYFSEFVVFSGNKKDSEEHPEATDRTSGDFWRHPNRYQNKQVPKCQAFKTQKPCPFDTPSVLIPLWVLQKQTPKRVPKQTGTKMPSFQKSKTLPF